MTPPGALETLTKNFSFSLPVASLSPASEGLKDLMALREVPRVDQVRTRGWRNRCEERGRRGRLFIHQTEHPPTIIPERPAFTRTRRAGIAHS